MTPLFISLTAAQCRLLIAEACGWKPLKERPIGGALFHTKWDHAKSIMPWLREHCEFVWAEPPADVGRGSVVVYDYFSDLNAIQTAIDCRLDDLVKNNYFRILSEVCYAEWPHNRDPHNPRADQRALAFGLALKLWAIEKDQWLNVLGLWAIARDKWINGGQLAQDN